MGRLIDADVLLKDIRDNSQSYFADDFAKEWVDRQPTVHPEQPKKGKWLPHPHDPQWDVCSACGIGVHRRVGDDEYSYCFCPWCGAKMGVKD